MSNETKKEEVKEDEEKKKWLIERVQTLVRSYIEKIELERARHKSHTDIVENDLTTLRSAIFGGVTFVATVILALLAMPSIGLWNELLLWLLITDIIIGLVVWVVFTLLMNNAHKLILNMNGYYFLASDILADLNSLIIKETDRIQEIEEEKIYFYWSYLAFASLAVKVYLIDIFNDISRSIIFWKEKGRWRFYWHRQRLTVKDAKEVYDENPQSRLNAYRVTYKKDVEHLNTYIEEFFKFDFMNYDGRKRATVTEPIKLKELDQKVEEIYRTVKKEGQGKS